MMDSRPTINSSYLASALPNCFSFCTLEEATSACRDIFSCLRKSDPSKHHMQYILLCSIVNVKSMNPTSDELKFFYFIDRVIMFDPAKMENKIKPLLKYYTCKTKLKSYLLVCINKQELHVITVITQFIYIYFLMCTETN
jgi:hypothetical protein